MSKQNGYFSELTINHLRTKQRLAKRYLRRAFDVTLACKLTHAYGKYQSDERQAESS